MLFLKKVLGVFKRPEHLWHEDFIVHLSKILKPNVYCELGLYKCELFNRIIPYSNKLIGLDMNPIAGKYMKKSNKTTFINETTDSYYEKIKNSGIKIDLLFIDADHSEESVKKDFENYFSLISDQGIILLHDGFPKNVEYAQRGSYCGDGYKAIEELSKITEKYEMVTIPVHPGLTICRKRTTQISW